MPKSTRPVTRNSKPSPAPSLAKVATGIQGFDEITGGGLPQGRPTLVCGGPGCGKTVFAMQFVINGVQQFGDPGVFMSFEEAVDDLTLNFVNFGFDLRPRANRKELLVDYVHVAPA